MDMYEAKQNKEAVSRRIDTAGTNQRIQIREKRSDLIQKMQLRAPKTVDNKHVSQFMAWVITRELNLGMSQSSNSASSSSRAPQGNNPAGSSHGSSDSSNGASLLGSSLSPTIVPSAGSDSLTASSSENGSKHSTSASALGTEGHIADANHIIDQPVSNIIDLENKTSVLGKIFNLKFHHRHILFSEPDNLPKLTGRSNNIGYGGDLYSESSLNGYQKNNQLSENKRVFDTKYGIKTEDGLLIMAISQHQNYGAYRLLTHNCQHWVNDVAATFDNLKKNSQELTQNDIYGLEGESSFYQKSFFFE